MNMAEESVNKIIMFLGGSIIRTSYLFPTKCFLEVKRPTGRKETTFVIVQYLSIALQCQHWSRAVL